MVKAAVKDLAEKGDFSSKEAIEEHLVGFIKGNEWPMGKVMNSLRLVLTGAASGLGIADIISFIGRDELLRRVNGCAL